MALALAGMYTRPYNNWSCALDFKRSYYKLGNTFASSFQSLPGATFTRPGEQLSYNPVTGKWQTFATDVPAIFSGAGMDIPEGTTNKCTNYNAAPTDLSGVTKSGDAAATLTVVDDTAALRAAGFGALIDAGKMNGKVYKLDNSAGVSSAFAAFSGTVGNTNTHTISCLVRGSLLGVAIVTVSGYVGTGTYTSYTVISGQKTPTLSSNVMYIGAGAGQIVYFILNQLEEKAYATNPVIVSGASATRGSTSATILNLASTLTTPFTLVAVANLSAIDGQVRRLLEASAAGSPIDNVRLARTIANEAGAFSSNGGVVVGASATGKTGPRLLKIAGRYRATQLDVAADGVLLSAGAYTPPSALSWLHLGQGEGSLFSLNSPLLFAGIAPDLTDTQLQAITASNGSLMDFL